MRARIALLFAIAAVAGAGYGLGLFDLLADRERLRALLADSGPWGPLLYVVAFGLLEPFGVPGAVFVIPASLVWPFWLAALLSWLGAVLAGVVGFAFARFLARDWVERRLPARLRAYDERLERRGLATVIVVRLIFFLAPPAHWLLGISKVHPGAFVVGSAVGFAPGIALLTVVGRSVTEWLLAEPRALWILGALILLGLVVARLLRSWRRLRSGAARDASAGPSSTR